MVLASLLDRSLGKPMGLRPRRLSLFERGGDLRIEATEGEGGVGPPRATEARIEAPAPQTPVPPQADTSPRSPENVAPVQRIETVERTRVERIVSESASFEPSASDAAKTDAPVAVPKAPPPVEAMPVEPRRTRSGRRGAGLPSAERVPVPIPVQPQAAVTERVHVIEQRLQTLSHEWTREKRVERTREIVRKDEAPGPAPRRSGPSLTAPVAAFARPDRLRPTAPPPATAPDPVVEVHIGRVELRATVANPPRANGRAPAPPEVGLETYLRKRDGR